MATFREHPSFRKKLTDRLPPWMVMGLALVLILTITVLAVRNAHRERAHMSQYLLDKANTLIWAVESGTRANMQALSPAKSVETLLAEVARQRGVLYIALTDASGHNIATVSNTTAGVEPWRTQKPHVSEVNHWRSLELPTGEDVFEVYRLFMPVPQFHKHMGGNADPAGESGHIAGVEVGSEGDHSEGEHADTSREHGETLASHFNREGEEIYIFIGLDKTPFEEALDEDLRNSLIAGSAVALLALGGLLSMFWAQNYRISRRLLQDTRALASEVVISMPSGLISTDNKHNITLINAEAAKLFGRLLPQMEGQTVNSLKGIPWPSIARRIDKGERVREEEYSFITDENEQMIISVSASRVKNDDGINLGYLFLVEDIRERKRVQEELRRSERLSSLGQMATRVAHEIRNPLSSIKGFARYLSDKVPAGGGKEIAFTMMDETDRLNRVVTELLDFARPSPLNLAPGAIQDVIKRALRLVDDDARKKNIHTSLTAAAVPLIPMDFERLTQVFLNLFINAIQAMDQNGSLTVTAGINAHGHPVVTVADTGHGIPQEEFPSIFMPYFTTKAKGTGLGLAIVMKILEEHDCAITVASPPGQGSTFTLTFSGATAAAKDE